MRPDIEDAKRLQRDLGLGDSHVVYVDIDTDWFAIAHTDAERAAMDRFPLTGCILHLSLSQGSLDHRMCCAGYAGHPPKLAFPETGWYEMPDVLWLCSVRGLAL